MGVRGLSSYLHRNYPSLPISLTYTDSKCSDNGRCENTKFAIDGNAFAHYVMDNLIKNHPSMYLTLFIENPEG